MFEKLIELLVHFWGAVTPVFIVRAYEGGVVLRFGKYARPLDAGLHFKIPFAETEITTTTAVTTLELRPQTLTTADGRSVVVSAIVKYAIRDPKPFLLEVWDSVDVLKDVTMGAIKTAVTARRWEELASPDAEKEVLSAARKEVNQYGFQIYRITFVDLGVIRSYRLITAPALDTIGNKISA